MNNEKDIFNNLPPFVKGQRVICVSVPDDYKRRIEVGELYTISSVFKCACGVWQANLVGINPDPHVTVSVCCGYRNETVYYMSERFAPLQSQSFPLLTLTKVIEEQHVLVSSN